MITQAELKEFLEYNPLTGEFIWAKDYYRVKKGTIAKSIIISGGKSYYRIKLKQVTYKTSRLAFLYMTGEFPTSIVDHKDGNTLNDKWENLRIASYSENSCNTVRSSANSSGIKGLSFVTINKHKYIYALISHKRKQYRKYFKPQELDNAIKWIREMRENLHKDFANHG